MAGGKSSHTGYFVAADQGPARVEHNQDHPINCEVRNTLENAFVEQKGVASARIQVSSDAESREYHNGNFFSSAGADDSMRGNR